MEAEWVFATSNSHKLAEAQAIVGERLRLVGLPTGAPSAPEPYDTLYANALAKAAFYASWLGRPVLAEDSGLFVPALEGRPGVQSARYGGPARLLEALQGCAHRRAYFVAVLVAYWGAERYRFFVGYLPGQITHSLRGIEGFGYDPVFCPEGHTETLAELGEAWKVRYSHRARAFQQLLAQLP